MKLKPLLVLLGMFTCSWLNSYSQVFAHPGATWVFHHPGQGQVCSQYYEVAKYVGDTLILGTPSKKIRFAQKTEWIVNPGTWQTVVGYHYFNVSGDTVSLFNATDSTWQEIYNFSVHIGDSVLNPLGNKLNSFAESCPDSLPYNDMAVVTDTGSTVIAGETLRYYTVLYYTHSPYPNVPDSLTTTFYERIISTGYWYPEDTYWCGITAECGNPGLICYSDNDWELDTNCNTVSFYETISIDQQDEYKNVKVYPNPVSQTLVISGSDADNFILLNMDGKVVLTSASDIINVENLANGIYIVTNTNRNWYKKIVKN